MTHKNERATTSTKISKSSHRPIWIGLCLLLIAITIPVIVYGYLILREGSRMASCRNDVFMFRESLRAYASHHEGLIPPLSQSRGNLMVEPAGFYPEYLENTCWLQCEWSEIRRRPGHHKNEDLGTEGFNDNSFCYLPWEIRTEAEGLAFIEAYKSLDLSRVEDDLEVQIDGKPHILPRIRLSEAVLSKNFVEDELPKVPIAVEWPDKFHWHGSVLYSNGWIVSMPLGDEFPMTEKFINGLREIADQEV